MKTRCIVNPGRAVRHERKRHVQGAVLYLGPQDVAQLTKSGDVSVLDEVAQQLPTGTDAGTEAGASTGTTTDQGGKPTGLTADQVAQAFDAMAAAIADGQLVPYGELAPQGGGREAAVMAPKASEGADQATKPPAAKKAAKRRS